MVDKSARLLTTCKSFKTKKCKRDTINKQTEITPVIYIPFLNLHSNKKIKEKQPSYTRSILFRKTTFFIALQIHSICKKSSVLS